MKSINACSQPAATMMQMPSTDQRTEHQSAFLWTKVSHNDLDCPKIAVSYARPTMRSGWRKGFLSESWAAGSL